MSITVNGVPLKTHLQQEQNKKTEKEAKKIYLDSQSLPLYKKPGSREIRTDRKPGPVIIYSRSDVMRENLEKTIREDPTLRFKVLAVLLLGQPVTVRAIQNYIKKRTGLRPKANVVSSHVSYIKKGPLGRFFTTKKQPGKSGANLVTFEADRFGSVKAALDWEKAIKKGNRLAAKSAAAVKAFDAAAATPPNEVGELEVSYGGIDGLVEKCIEKNIPLEISIKIGGKEAA